MYDTREATKGRERERALPLGQHVRRARDPLWIEAHNTNLLDEKENFDYRIAHIAQPPVLPLVVYPLNSQTILVDLAVLTHFRNRRAFPQLHRVYRGTQILLLRSSSILGYLKQRASYFECCPTTNVRHLLFSLQC
jgi:hypothetical protein